MTEDGLWKYYLRLKMGSTHKDWRLAMEVPHWVEDEFGKYFQLLNIGFGSTLRDWKAVLKGILGVYDAQWSYWGVTCILIGGFTPAGASAPAKKLCPLMCPTIGFVKKCRTWMCNTYMFSNFENLQSRTFLVLGRYLWLLSPWLMSLS